MNKARRKRINESIIILTDAQIKLNKALEEEKSALARIANDEDKEDQRDAMEEIISNLEDAVSNLEETLDTLNNADF